MASPRLLLLLPFLYSCAGTGPSRSLASVLAERNLPERSPVVLVDLDDTVENGHVNVERTVIILIEDGNRPDPDREDLPEEVLSRPIPGRGAAWPRILSAYRNGKLKDGATWVISQPAGDARNE